MVMELEWKVGAVFSYVVLMLLSFVGDYFNSCYSNLLYVLDDISRKIYRHIILQNQFLARRFFCC